MLVGLLRPVGAHHGLHRFCQHLPGIREVLLDGCVVGFELADALAGAVVGDQRVAERRAQAAQRRGVGEVPLPAGDSELVGKVAEHRAREADVPFGVLEVDGVHLVWHRRAAGLAGGEPLLEVADGDVAPGIAVEIQQHLVEAGEGVEQLGDVVVRLDLRGVGVECQPQPFDELPARRWPVHLRVGDGVGVVVADGAVHLAENGHFANLIELPPESHQEVAELLADGGGRGRLAVGASQHRHVDQRHG